MSQAIVSRKGVDRHGVPVLREPYEPKPEEELTDAPLRMCIVSTHSCPQCLGYFDGPGDCPTCGGRGTITEAW